MPEIILDSNLAILLIVGLTSRDLIGTHRNLRAYSHEDFDCLLDLIQGYSPIVVSPNTLTEVSNLCRQVREPYRSRISAAFQRFIGTSSEEYVPSAQAIRNVGFMQLGLTDAVMLEQMDRSRLLLTADHDLFVAATRLDLIAINFNHYRPVQ
jgi:hypothetical protein